jgi:hypothetical protein
MRAPEQTFRLGEFGEVPVTIFHPPLGGVGSKNHILFVPPHGCRDIDGFADALDALALKEKSFLYALRFDAVSPGRRPTVREELERLVPGAILFLRAGSEQLIVYTCSLATTMVVSGCAYLRQKDEVRTFRP